MHPLADIAIRLRNFKGFGDDPGDWLRFEPITVLVGRNNSGKSAIIDGLRVILSQGKSFKDDYHHAGSQASLEVDSAISEQALRGVFPNNVSGGGVPGNARWEFGSR